MVLVLSYLLKLDDASARYQYQLKAVSHMSTTYATLNDTTHTCATTLIIYLLHKSHWYSHGSSMLNYILVTDWNTTGQYFSP